MNVITQIKELVAGPTWLNENGEPLPGGHGGGMGILHAPVVFGIERHQVHGKKGVYYEFYLGRPVLVIATQSIASEFYSAGGPKRQRDGTFCLFGEISEKTMGKSLGAADGEDWKRIRKTFTPEFSQQRVQKLFAGIHDMTRDFVRGIYAKQDSLDVYADGANKLPIYIISRLTYGRYLTPERWTRLQKLSVDHGALMGEMIKPRSQAIFGLVSVHGSDLTAFQKNWLEFNLEIAAEIRAEKEAGKTSDDILFANMLDGELTQDELFDTIDEIVLLNEDVTYLSIGMSLVDIAENIDVQTKVREEIEQVLGADIDSFTFSDVQKLKYLQAVVKESARFHPTVAFTFPERLMEDAVIGGYHIPQGVPIILDTYSINRDPNIWPDPDRFSIDNGAVDKPQLFHRMGLSARKCIANFWADAMIKSFIICTLMSTERLSTRGVKVGVRDVGFAFLSPYTVFPPICNEKKLPRNL